MRKRRAISWLLALSLLLGTCPMLAATAAAADPTNLTSWTDDGLKRYGQSEDAPATPSQKISLEAARNEYERGQIVVRSDAQDFEVTSVEFTALQKADGETIGAENLHYHFALYEVNIPTDHCGVDWKPNVQGQPLYAKSEMCDALSNATSISVVKGCNQPIYLEVFVPAGTRPGLYEGQVTVKTSLGDIQKELTVQVFDATVPEMKDADFTYYNWMTDLAQGQYAEWNAFTTYYKIQDVENNREDFTSDFYKILNNWAEIATDHRQNMVLVNTIVLLEKAKTTVNEDGTFNFDWTLFDKYVDVWLRHGVTRVAGIHLVYNGKDWMLKDDGTGHVTHSWEKCSESQKNEWYRQYLPALAEHLESYDLTQYPQFAGTENKTLFDIWCQHSYDEPHDMKLWDYYATMVRTYLVSGDKNVKILDADGSGQFRIHDQKYANKLDICVPVEGVTATKEQQDYYHAQVAAGKEFWTYVCLQPDKPWLNRFVGQPDTTYPMLFWYNAKIQATGYLHWGWNVWNVGPFCDGDSYMVYPDVEGKTLLRSIRFDGQRDGVEDWELAQLARKTNDATTQQLLDMAVVHPMGQYVTKIQDYRALRRAILELASGTDLEELPEISEPGNSLPKLPENAYYVDDLDQNIQYKDMEKYENGTSYGGTVHYHDHKGAAGSDGGSASYTFTGNGIGILGEKNWNGGKMRIDLYDAENQKIDSRTVNCYSSAIEPGFIPYEKTDLPYGTYTITVTNVRVELPNNPRSQMVLDAFIVYDDAYAENHVTVEKAVTLSGRITLRADGKELASGDKVLKGTEIQVTAEPLAGFYCQYVDINGQILESPCTVKANQNVRVKAIFREMPETAAPENVALKKNVTASSVGKDYTKEGAVDGSRDDTPAGASHAWSNTSSGGGSLKEDAWICVDLGKSYVIDKTVLSWCGTWDAIVPDQYLFQVSDKAEGSFETVYTQDGKEPGEGHVHTFAPVEAQFVKVLIPKDTNQKMGWDAVRLNELEVYEHTEPVEQNKTALKEQIKAAEALAEADYAADSWTAMEKTLREAQIVDVDAYATQDEIDAAAAALADAVKALVPKEEKPVEPDVEPDVKPDVKPDWRPVHPVQPEKPEDNRFTDVRPNDYYYDAVNWSAENGITTGVDSLHFAPDLVCTRAQAVTFLWRAAGSPEPANQENPFTDVKDTDYFCKAVLWAVEEGITTGTSETTFSPGMMCSRAHIVTFLWRAKRMPLASGTNPFADVKPDDYFCDAVQWAVNETITTGTSNTTFSPDAPCTRAQIVTFLYRTYVD